MLTLSLPNKKKNLKTHTGQKKNIVALFLNGNYQSLFSMFGIVKFQSPKERAHADGCS